MPEVCRKMGIAEQTFYRWKKKFAGIVSPPAIIVLVAGRSGDAEALLITLEKLSGRNYTVLEAGATSPGYRFPGGGFVGSY